MNLKIILSLLGIKKDNLGDKLFSLIFAFGNDAIRDEIRRFFSKRMSPKMRSDVALALNVVSQSLSRNDDDAAAQQLCDLLAMIKP